MQYIDNREDQEVIDMDIETKCFPTAHICAFPKRCRILF